MEDLLPRIRDCHRQAFGSCPFVYYLDLGAIPTDRTTLQKIIPKLDEKSRRFRFAASLHAFTPSCIRSHTFLPTDDVSVKKNTEETSLWRKYFSGKPWEKQRDETDKEKEIRVMQGGKIPSENKQKLVTNNLPNLS